VLLGLALERLAPQRQVPGERMVRVAEVALTMLHGAAQLAAAAPGFGEIFDVVRACEQLAALDLGDRRPVPPIVATPSAVDAPWGPPPGTDLVRAAPARLDGDGVVAVLGLHRLVAAEDAVRAAPPGTSVTAVLVSDDPAELMPLARLAVADLCGCLRQAFPAPAWPGLQVVCDPAGVLAAAAGVTSIDGATETAVRVAGGRIVARADGWGACYAVAAEVPVGEVPVGEVPAERTAAARYHPG
jgi:hypothetical protein